MECEVCGKPYMAGLSFVFTKDDVFCKSCYDKYYEANNIDLNGGKL